MTQGRPRNEQGQAVTHFNFRQAIDENDLCHGLILHHCLKFPALTIITRRRKARKLRLAVIIVLVLADSLKSSKSGWFKLSDLRRELNKVYTVGKYADNLIYWSRAQRLIIKVKYDNFVLSSVGESLLIDTGKAYDEGVRKYKEIVGEWRRDYRKGKGAKGGKIKAQGDTS